MGNCLQVEEAGGSSDKKNTCMATAPTAPSAAATGSTPKKREESSNPASTSNNGSLYEQITLTDHSRQGRGVFEVYEIVQAIAEGSTCKIYAVKKKGENASTNNSGSSGSSTSDVTGKKDRLYALKEITKDQVDDVFLREMRNEVAILRTLDHPNIVRVYDMFEDKRHIYMVMEYLTGGDLYARIPYTEAQAAKIMTKVVSAITYLHQKKIVHRDIKMENIMLESDSDNVECKLIDFGLSTTYIAKGKSMDDVVGTVYSMSPQVIQGNYTAKADVWSCGVICYILLSNRKPFEGRSKREIAEKILSHEIHDEDFAGPEWADISKAAKKFVSSLLKHEEEKRITASQALRSPWLNKTFPLDQRRPEESVMNDVTHALIQSASDHKFKKVAMQVIAYRSSTSEIEQLRSVFDQFDNNNTGSVSYYEFRRALAQSGFDEAEMKRVFKSIDVNNSGAINYNEFIAATLEARGAIEDEQVLSAFDKLDVDDTGYISKENICTILGNKCSIKDCDAIVNDLVAEVDANNDGLISYDEFHQLFRQKSRKEPEIGCGCQPKEDAKVPTCS